MDDDFMGYTFVTLSVGLWAYWHSTSFVDGLLKVVNAGGDADTNELFPPPLHALTARGGEEVVGECHTHRAHALC